MGAFTEVRTRSRKSRGQDRSFGASSEAALTGAFADVNPPEIPFQRAFQHVADDKDVVIGIREPNRLGASLLREGYASKSFYVKAKSSVSGPTAGFVVADPELGKLGTSGEEQQRKYIDDALKHGAGKVPLRLSEERVKELRELGLLRGRLPGAVYAGYGATTRYFEMRRLRHVSELPWAVFHESGAPVESLSNPQRLGGPTGPKAAVTADYDLFGLFPRPNRVNNVRPLNPVARTVGPNKAGIGKHADAYLNAIRLTGRPMDPDLGNFHYYGETIRNALNKRITEQGYRGGTLVHHGDETNHPYSQGQDFPVRFIVPHRPALLVNNDAQLLRAYGWFGQLGYSVEVNPAFAFASYSAHSHGLGSADRILNASRPIPEGHWDG